ncbi:N-acetyl-anhydromuranmyl-L-alanine amidase [Jeongeupia sp. HS-3]|uniref:1,6-anhydro-N-acetylmuramyl-L-alanine amidase AmpD n=1 Tax=Jeongeupia sp. HS-3 TaxID=1009682 RepID=UPI0018A5965B|nr:1,6-anhydro-N-acetylmuramyl-L-alanine amidase AmpD [Jeongeupia sp. HS-3]BCL76439.1 N-acetyl-anhydromuranmyl-L-alanine amidase [Jeongeupia sp. HS-3]
MSWQIDEAGWCDTAIAVPSPNCDARPDGAEINLLVVHNISLPAGQFGGDHVLRLFTNRIDPQAAPGYDELARLRVSAHFFIRRDGTVLQFVPTTARAWHAGVSSWRDRPGCNDVSIGVELEGSDLHVFENIQYDALILLAAALRMRHPVKEVVGHCDIAPLRKTDPGPYFDWTRIHAALPQLKVAPLAA